MSLFTLALLMAPREGGGGLLPFIFMYGSIFAIFYFLLIRPQRRMQRQHQEMISALQRGDEIVTDGGIIGEVVHIAEDRVTIRTGENTRLVIARPKIARVLTKRDTPAAAS